MNDIEIISNELSTEIKKLILEARAKIGNQIDITLLDTYWKVGQIIIKKEQLGKVKADYGKKILLNASKSLTKELGKGFSKSNLFNMKKLFLTYSKIPDTFEEKTE